MANKTDKTPIESELAELKQLFDSDTFVSENIEKKISKIDKKILKLETKLTTTLATTLATPNIEPPSSDISSIIEELALIETRIDTIINAGPIDRLINEFVKFKSKLDSINILNDKDYKINLEYL